MTGKIFSSLAEIEKEYLPTKYDKTVQRAFINAGDYDGLVDYLFENGTKLHPDLIPEMDGSGLGKVFAGVSVKSVMREVNF